MRFAWIDRAVDGNGIEKEEPFGINPEKVICARRVTFASADGKKVECTEIICEEKIRCRTLLSLEEAAERLEARGARSSGRAPGRPDYSGAKFI